MHHYLRSWRANLCIWNNSSPRYGGMCLYSCCCWIITPLVRGFHWEISKIQTMPSRSFPCTHCPCGTRSTFPKIPCKVLSSENTNLSLFRPQENPLCGRGTSFPRRNRRYERSLRLWLASWTGNVGRGDYGVRIGVHPWSRTLRPQRTRARWICT